MCTLPKPPAGRALSEALVSGRLQQRDYTDKEGRKRTAYEVVVGRIYFTDKKEESKPSVADFAVIDDDDELPFA